jgi:TolB-like protein/class 3 adenylate cyclase/Flp pilus assembly protein TadD
MPPVRRLTAILAADVAGHSRLMGADEEGTHERLKAHLSELVDPSIRQHRGRTVKNTGDGFLAEFGSVVDSVRCAVEVQRGMVEREADVLNERRIRFRIGINLGDVIADADDIFGDGVNVAARLEGLAEPGGICIARTVRDQIRDKLPYSFEDMGEQSVKNIARPVRVYALRPEAGADLASSIAPTIRHRRRMVETIAAAVAAGLVIAGSAWWFWPTTKPSPIPALAATTSIAQPLVPPRLSIVVLPFANLSNDPDQQYFADGISDDLTTDLSRIAEMFVISRNTALTYRNKPIDTKQIGRELGVRYVLEGSVRKSGNQIRINAQLIDAATDAHLWAERFDSDMGDVFALQNEITSRLANALGVELTAAEAARPTERPDALDYVLRASAAMSKPPRPASYAEAASMFERALDLDPGYSEAQSRLSALLASRVIEGMTNTPEADLTRAEELAAKAVAIAPGSFFAHFARALVLRAQGRCTEAIPEYETAITLNRNWVNTLAALGMCKVFTGSIDEAIPLFEQAIRLSPRDAYTALWYDWIGRAYLLRSRTDDAILWFEKARSANAALLYVHAYLASAYALKGEIERAAAELAGARSLGSDGRYSSIARLKSAEYFGVPKIRVLFEGTYLAGLRKAGMPEE